MSKRTDQEYLREVQYKDASNLNTRISLHELFSTNPQDWFRWVFEKIMLQEPLVILEVGCGSGMLWKHNQERIPSDWKIHLTDVSPGMLHACRTNIDQPASNSYFSALDAQFIPYRSKHFDVVVANHMLYHIPDRPHALSEIHRVLKQNGKLIAATNGMDHMAEIRELICRVDPSIALQIDYAFGANEFTVESGISQLLPWFEKIEIVPFIDALEVTDAKPVIDYMLSMNVSLKNIPINAQHVTTIRQYIDQIIGDKGFFHVTKSTALFIATRKD